MPLVEVAGAQVSFPCSACGAQVSTTRARGQRARCSFCNERVRVPLLEVASAPVTFPCSACGAEVSSARPPGQRARCEACGERVRVPLPAAASGYAFVCPACGDETESPVAPGQRTTCRSCGSPVRVPLRAAEETAPASADAMRPRVCSSCGTELTGAIGECPECRLERVEGFGRSADPLLPLARRLPLPEGRAALAVGAGLVLVACVGLLARGESVFALSSHRWRFNGLLVGLGIVGGLMLLSELAGRRRRR